MFLISSCGNPAGNSQSGMHSHDGNEKEHNEGGTMGEHMHSEAGGGHMNHMNDVRGWLKGELGDDYDMEIPHSTDAEIEAGKAVYIKVCQSCHGESGKGDGPAAKALNPKPADFTDPEHSMFYSDNGRLYIIKNGIKGTAMVGWKSVLSAKDINNVYAYVRSLRKASSGHEHNDHNHSH